VEQSKEALLSRNEVPVNLWNLGKTMSRNLSLTAIAAAGLLYCAVAFGATSGITFSVTLPNEGGRLAYERADGALISDPAGADGYRDVWRYVVDNNGKRISSVCLTCGNPEMPYHNGNPRYDPFGRGFMFQVENKACPAAALGNAASPGSGSCNDWWYWAAGNQQFYPVSAPLPSYDGRYAQMHGKWSKNGDYFIFGYRIPDGCTDNFGCNFGGSWELQAVEISWANPAPNVYVPSFGTVHVYTPGNWPKHFYQMTGTSPVDNGMILFESNSFNPVNALGDIDVATMSIRASDGTWLTNEQANATVKILSEFNSDGSHSAEWNELAEFVPDGSAIQWMSNRGYPEATSLADLYSDYWRCDPDGSNKRQISFFNTPNYPEYTGQRTIASNYTFLSIYQFYSYIFRASSAPDNIYRLVVPTTSMVVTNAATFFTNPGISPGSLASAFVAGLGGFTATTASTLPWQTKLNGVQITVNGVAAPVYYVGPAANGNPGQINFQVPYNTALGQANLTVTVNDTPVANATASVVEVSPGIFLSNAVSLQGSVLNENNSLNATAVEATRDEALQIFATGGGPVDAPPADGTAASPYSNTRYMPKVYFGSTEVTAFFSGVVGYPGLWQINARVPNAAGISGLVPVYVVQNGVPSNLASVWVKP
jgi:uncharacterized protein (TIGR03437 family)